jgi:hypothetical protein
MPDRAHLPLYLCTHHHHLETAVFVVADNGLDDRINGVASRLVSSLLYKSHHLYNVVIVRRRVVIGLPPLYKEKAKFL